MRKLGKVVVVCFVCLCWKDAYAKVDCPTRISERKITDINFSDAKPVYVVDAKNKLMWIDCVWSFNEENCDDVTVSRYSWSGTLKEIQLINEKEFLGFSNWRLPTVKELLSVVSRKCYVVEQEERRIDLLDIPAAKFWSSQPYVFASPLKEDVINGVQEGSTKSHYRYFNRKVRLVRDIE